MTIEEHLKQLKKRAANHKKWREKDLPRIVGVEAVNFFTESFQNEGFTDETLEKWTEVKRRSNPKRVDRAAAKRPILTGETGDLGKSIEFTPSPDQVKITSDTMGASSDKDYAKPHNEGTTNAGKNHNVVIPKRQFIGKSKKNEENIADVSEKYLKKILK